MAFKIAGLLTLAVVVNAQSGIGYYGHSLQKQQPHLQPLVHYQPQVQVYQQPQVHYQPQYSQHEEEHHAPAHYQYQYGVHDDHTGDVHGQQESREADKTEGEYYLIDADGHKRTVTYYVHGKSGFIAQVHREPVKGHHIQQQQQQQQYAYHH
ncbi:larval cuticle protein A1A-like [Armigeres subalbatus]|uniref:larval cuticle protein A1A-like n=1 Tax=Armigeres subalbatus TaxID=124917 RepID=UPI002ED3A8D6